MADDQAMKILVATDVHLGYLENHAERGDDSFVTFEEILKCGKDMNVDLILLGGDLFHETRPSTTCLHRCISLLRRYCLGDREIQIEFLSDQSLNFKHLLNPQVNYEDPNQNVAIPVFSIHGNHDDPTGASRLSALDLLADIGLVNYFGKWTSLTEVEIHPLLLQKGETKLALYGLSHIRDERLSRLFASGHVKMPRAVGQYFNLLVLHQNRADRGPKNFIPEDVLPSFLDLVVWGHEHDCNIIPTECKSGVHITQPGSSVATSLAEGESLPKHIGLLHIKGQEYKLEKILLKTVRPFIFRSVLHTDKSTSLQPQEETKAKVVRIIEDMIEEAKTKVHEDEPKQPKLPLIRLVFIFHDERQQFNAIRLGQQFVGRVANPEDIIMLKCKRQTQRSSNKAEASAYDSDDSRNVVTEGPFSEQVERLLEMFMETENTKPLNVLTVKAMCEATTRFLEKNDEGAFEDVIAYQSTRTRQKLEEKDLEEEHFTEMLHEIRLERTKEAEATEIKNLLNNPKRNVRTYVVDEGRIVDDSDDDATFEQTVKPESPKKPAKGRGSRGPRRSRARGRAT